jgi:hypothetical protein
VTRASHAALPTRRTSSGAAEIRFVDGRDERRQDGDHRIASDQAASAVAAELAVIHATLERAEEVDPSLAQIVDIQFRESAPD